MVINATVQLGPDDDINELAADNPTELAREILTAVGGDPEKDVCTVQLMGTGSIGQLATVAPTPPTEPAP